MTRDETLMRPRLHAVVFFALIGVAQATPRTSEAQTATARPFELALESTPLGALPPMALPMPASRDHNYWVFRLQYGTRQGLDTRTLRAAAAGLDYQVRGGSVFGLTAGYQDGDCVRSVLDCGTHMLYGARARMNFATAGSTVALLAGAESATTTIGAEVGIGYAPSIASGVSGCVSDIGLPISVAMLERVRLVAFFTPGAAWDLGCSSTRSSSRISFYTSMGMGVQQFLVRGLDVNLGLQRIFRGDLRYAFGATVTYTVLP
jgi:hypothetical protein